MTILKRQFHSHEIGMSDEDWYYLARDTDSGRIFVYHEWSHRKGQTYEGGNKDMELQDFLAHNGTAQARLRELIGTLAAAE
jgi:hypothetical protein